MARSGPMQIGFGGDLPIVRVDTAAARALTTQLRRAGGTLWDAHVSIGALAHEAAAVLRQPTATPPFAEIALHLGRDADDLEWRIDFLEATDGFTLAGAGLAGRPPIRDWAMREPSDLSFDQLAVLIAHAEADRELHDLLTWMLQGRSGAGTAFVREDILDEVAPIPNNYRALFAGAFITAYESGWRDEQGQIPTWMAAGMAAHGQLSDDSLVELGLLALHDDDGFRSSIDPNPFDVERAWGPFGPFAAQFVDRPEVGRRFIDSLLLDFARTGDTQLNMHEDRTLRSIQLGDIVVASGTVGPVEKRTDFVDRLIRVINADHDTNAPVFWATWAVHAELALQHDIITTEPTFAQHHLVPDFVRPTWEHHWHEHVSPFALRTTFEFVQQKKAEARILGHISNPTGAITDWLLDRFTPEHAEPYNDAGGTYSARPKEDFHGMRFHFGEAARGRHVVIHALEDGSDRGDIGQDEFAIIDHGLGADGRPTYTVNLPGVIDLSNPVPGWDPEHMSVRDMDMAALLSATSANVEDNLYAQMVIRGLRTNGVDRGSNLLLVGHSFGADTVADLAANTEFTNAFNVTHVVAAAYDSVPQLAHISSEIDVLVLQNEDDKAILLEATQRRSAMSDESVSANTFAHEVRVFDGGWGFDAGHHQDRYIAYLEATDDPELTRFYESIAATGYGESGTSVAIDVTLDQNLLNR